MRDFTVFAPCDIDLDVLWKVKNRFETEEKLCALDRRTVTLLSEQSDESAATRRRVTECRLGYNPVPKLFQRIVKQEHLRTRVDSEWYDTHHDAKHPCISKVSLPHFDGQFSFSVTVWQWLDSAGKDGVTNRIVTRVNIDIRSTGPVSAIAERIMEHDMRQAFYRYPGSLLEHCRVDGIATHPAAADAPAALAQHEQQQRDALLDVPLCIEDAAVEEASRVSCNCYGCPTWRWRLRRKLRLRDTEPEPATEEASCNCRFRGWGGCFLWREGRMTKEMALSAPVT